jgi:uncharacterized peroxidase-related enzyme
LPRRSCGAIIGERHEEIPMFLRPAPDTDDTRALYADRERGYVMNYMRLWAWRPALHRSFVALRTQLMETTTLSKRELAVLVCAMARSLGDSYCALAWGERLAQASDAATAAALLRDGHADTLSEREQALAQWAQQVVYDPNATSPRDIERLREAGLAEEEIFDATLFVAFRQAFSTVNDALGAEPDGELAQEVPPEVRRAVTFGRAPAQAD